MSNWEPPAMDAEATGWGTGLPRTPYPLGIASETAAEPVFSWQMCNMDLESFLRQGDFCCLGEPDG